MSDLSIVSLDSGSSYMKAVFGNREYIEPSLHAEVKPTSQVAERICHGGRWFVAGRRAYQQLKDAAPRPDTKDDFHGSERQHIQILYTLNALEAHGDHDILILSVPYGDYERNDLISRLTARKTFSWTTPDGEERTARFKRVFVVPQGTGAFSFFQMNHDPARQNPQERAENLVVVDVGSCTTDVVTLIWDELDESYVYQEATSKSLKNVSTGVFMDRLSSAIFSKRPNKFDVDYHEFSTKIQAKKFFLKDGSTTIPFEEEFEATREWFTKLLLSELDVHLGKNWRRADMVVLTGGGEEYLANWTCEARTARLDLLSNARGQIIFVKEALTDEEIRKIKQTKFTDEEVRVTEKRTTKQTALST